MHINLTVNPIRCLHMGSGEPEDLPAASSLLPIEYDDQQRVLSAALPEPAEGVLYVVGVEHAMALLALGVYRPDVRYPVIHSRESEPHVALALWPLPRAA